MPNKKIVTLSLIGGSLLAITGASAYAANVSAATTSSPDDTLISRIAKKFNLSKTDLKKEFDSARQQMHEEHEAERKKAMETQLQKKVDDKTITAAQKTELLKMFSDEHAAMEKNRTSGTKPDRTKMEAQHKAFKAKLDAWAKKQGLDLSKILPQPSNDDGRGPGGHGPGRF